MPEITTKDIFISPTKGKMAVERMVGELVAFMDEDEFAPYRLVIGSDSKSKKLNGNQQLDFVTAVVIHRFGKGARYFWQKNRKNGLRSLRDKIYTETLLSLSLAQKIVPQLKARASRDCYDLEIHIDVGENGPTREMIREVVGIVNGNGFTAKTKPESYGASCVADKYTK
jgi:predicted RNase H-related nuclease YkuK (DUF458 family)